MDSVRDELNKKETPKKRTFKTGGYIFIGTLLLTNLLIWTNNPISYRIDYRIDKYNFKNRMFNTEYPITQIEKDTILQSMNQIMVSKIGEYCGKDWIESRFKGYEYLEGVINQPDWGGFHRADYKIVAVSREKDDEQKEIERLIFHKMDKSLSLIDKIEYDSIKSEKRFEYLHDPRRIRTHELTHIMFDKNVPDEFKEAVAVMGEFEVYGAKALEFNSELYNQIGKIGYAIRQTVGTEFFWKTLKEEHGFEIIEQKFNQNYDGKCDLLIEFDKSENIDFSSFRKQAIRIFNQTYPKNKIYLPPSPNDSGFSW